MLALATISVTEDMATSMRLHGAGWKSVYHHEILAYGLAPEDPKTMVTQRLRWAQGTIQVMLRENPLVQKGMTVAQRLMYWSTMWSYLSGFAALAYFAAPVIYLVFGILPVEAFSLDFFARLVPFLILSQLLFFVVGRGTPTWRGGQQYSLALFPVWIRACWTAFLNVYFDKPLDFAVTPEDPSGQRGCPLVFVPSATARHGAARRGSGHRRRTTVLRHHLGARRDRKPRLGRVRLAHTLGGDPGGSLPWTRKRRRSMSHYETRQVGTSTVVQPTGRLNMVAAPRLREQLRDLVENGSRRLVVDLSTTEFIDSSGLGALVSG